MMYVRFDRMVKILKNFMCLLIVLLKQIEDAQMKQNFLLKIYYIIIFTVFIIIFIIIITI